MADADGNATNEPADADDVRDLRAFVVQMRELLEAIVDDGRYIPRDQRRDVREAWVHAKADLDELAAALASDSLNDTSRSRLEQHGLTGAPLRMKLRAWRKKFFSFGRRMNRPWLRQVLKWGDTILGSLVDAMTLGAAGKEFKEAMEHFIEDAAEK